MKKKRLSEEQIIGVLKEAEAGANTKDLGRKHGISDQTFNNWKAEFGGMTVFQARRLKALERENSWLMRLLGGSGTRQGRPERFAQPKMVGPQATTRFQAGGIWSD